MDYVTSDLHGYSLDKFKGMLEKVGFSQSDRLYVLGDCIDRGKDGIGILQWLMAQPNAELILGNHEAMMLSCDFLFADSAEKAIGSFHAGKINQYAAWVSNGARPTIRALSAMDRREIRELTEYLKSAPLYETITVADRDFILTHSGLGSFQKDKKLSEYSRDELLWNRPDWQTSYFEDRTVVFGHTPTLYFGEAYKGKAIVTETWIDVDVGAGMGLVPMLLRLDDLQAFYFDEDGNITDCFEKKEQGS